MKTFEIFSESKKKGQNGRRKFKLVLYKIQPDNCIDTENEVGTEYNLNGITWIREYCEQALGSIEGMFLRCEFLDEDRTEICGHGMTEIEDGVPIFENATTIGMTMLQNSEFLVFLAQKEDDLEIIKSKFKLSENQAKYLDIDEPGKGLIKCGKRIIPFSNLIPQDSLMYSICTTKFKDIQNQFRTG